MWFAVEQVFCSLKTAFYQHAKEHSEELDKRCEVVDSISCN